MFNANLEKTGHGLLTDISIVLLLITAIASIYGRTADFNYVQMDDVDYVLLTEPVMQGLTLEGIQWAFTTFEIHRSLHCWQFSFNWIPTGFRQSFTFAISPKSSLLQDLKLNKRKSWQDLNAQQF